MKKYFVLSLSLLTLLSFGAPALAAQAEGEPAHDDLLDLDPPAQSEPAPNVSSVPAENAQADGEPAEPIDGSGDVPADESAWREEPPGSDAPAQRQPGQGTVRDIYAYWEENGYPGDVAYAYQAGGEMVGDETFDWWEIGLVGNDPARQQEILELVSPACLVEFKNALFTHEEKANAYQVLTELAVTDPNILQVIFVRNGDSVWVAVPEEVVKEYAKYLIRDLGLGAVVSVTDEGSLCSILTEDLQGNALTGAAPGGGLDLGRTPSVGGGDMVPAAAERGGISAFWLCLALAVAMAAALTAFALRRAFVPAAVTAEGAVRAQGPLSRRQTAQAVKDSMEAPGPALRQAIAQKLFVEQTKPTKTDE